MRSQFEAVIREFCQLVGLSDFQHVVDGEPVSADGVAFSIVFDERVGTDLAASGKPVYATLPAGLETTGLGTQDASPDRQLRR